MQYERSHGINWWVGSNGNLFGDRNEWRYCISRDGAGGYVVTRDGQAFARCTSVADAKLCVKRDSD